MYPVISISRQFGSGGHAIGQLVAQRLSIPFFDKEIVEECSAESGFSKDVIEEQGEQVNRANKWFDLSSSAGGYFQSAQDEIFLAQRHVILEHARKGPCVIVGRCSDYILSEENDSSFKYLNVLIHANMDIRKENVHSRFPEIKEHDLVKFIEKKDKQRNAYYQYYTDRKWGLYSNYHIALDNGSLGEDKCVKIICDLAECMND